MNRLMKEKVKRILVGLLVLTIALGPITPTLTQAAILKQQDDSTYISQRLSDDEMKEIVGGGGVKRWVKRVWRKLFLKQKPYTVNVYVHTNVPGSEGQWYGINGYEKIGGNWVLRDVKEYWYGREYLEGEFTIRGTTAGTDYVEAKAELYSPLPQSALLDEATGGVTVGKNETKRIDLYLNR